MIHTVANIYVQIDTGYINMYTMEAGFDLIVLRMYQGSFYGKLKETIPICLRWDGAFCEIKLYLKSEVEVWAHVDLALKTLRLMDIDYKIAENFLANHGSYFRTFDKDGVIKG
jgi:hypothetical protein